MNAGEALEADALCHAARDVARHIAGLAEELSVLRHASGGESQTLVDRQLVKLRAQLTLLTGVVGDLEKTQHAAPAASL
jgi:hypothetical protein